MKRDVISDLFMMLWFQKGFLDTVGLSPKMKNDIRSPKCAEGGGGALVKEKSLKNKDGNRKKTSL